MDAPKTPRKLKPRVTYEEAKPLIRGLIDAGNAEPSAGDLLASIQRGSKTTMQSHIDRYFAEEKPTIRTFELTMPLDAQEFYLRALSRQVSEAIQITEAKVEKLTAEKTMVIKESQQFETDLELARAQVEDLRDEISEKNGAIGQLEKAKADAEKRVAEIEEAAGKEVQAAKEEADRLIQIAREETDRIRLEAESARTALAKAELRLEGLPRLETEIGRLQGELKIEQEGRHKASEAAAVAEARVEELKIYRSKAETAETELAAAREARAKAEKEAALASDRSKNHEASLSEAKTMIDRLSSAQEKLLARFETEQEKRQTSENQLASIQATFESEKIQRQTAENQLDDLRKRIQIDTDQKTAKATRGQTAEDGDDPKSKK